MTSTAGPAESADASVPEVAGPRPDAAADDDAAPGAAAPDAAIGAAAPDAAIGAAAPDAAIGAASPVTPAPRSRYAMGSGANMLRSLLVIGALVLGLVLLVPRVGEIRQPPVDAAGVVAAAVAETRLPLLYPTGLDAGWTVTSARYAAFTDQILTWQAGWTTPDDHFVGLKQAVGVTPAWLDAATAKGKVTGTEQVAGRTWEVRVDERRQTYLVGSEPVTGGVLTTVVAGTGGLEQLRAFVARLAPAAPAR